MRGAKMPPPPTGAPDPALQLLKLRRLNLPRLLLFIASTALLAGCGSDGGEDYAIDLAASPSVAMGILSQTDFTQQRALLGTLDIRKSRPTERELVYTIPSLSMTGNKREDGIVRFVLERMKDGRATKLHVSVDVPQVPILMGEANKVLSETKVEGELRKILDSLNRKLASGSSASASQDLSSLLVAVAIASNDRMQAQANDFNRDPAAYAERVGLLDDMSAGDADYAGAADAAADGHWGNAGHDSRPDPVSADEPDMAEDEQDDWGQQ